MNTVFIENNTDLANYCWQASKQSKIAIDTEFMRIRTRFPQFALLQIYDGETVALVDPLKISDWEPVKSLLTHPDVTKYLHSGSEDLEVFHHHLNVLPKPFIDTQVLAAFAGEGLSCGLAKLLESHLNITLDKSETRTDWLARPLSDAQLKYAALDVFYLLDLADLLWSKITDNKLKEFAIAECELLLSKQNKVIDLDTLYSTMPHVEELKPIQLAVLQELAAWRWQEAAKRDLALNFVVHELNLFAIAKAMPKTLNELQALKIHPNELRQHGEKLIEIVTSALARDPTSYPKPVKLLHHYPEYKQHLTLLKEQISVLAEQYHIPEQLIASKKQLNQLLKCRYEGGSAELFSECAILTGWRREVCSESLKAMGFWKEVNQ